MNLHLKSHTREYSPSHFQTGLYLLCQATPVKDVKIPHVPKEESFHLLSWEVEDFLPCQRIASSSKTAWELEHPMKDMKRSEHKRLVVIYGALVSEDPWKSIGLAGPRYYQAKSSANNVQEMLGSGTTVVWDDLKTGPKTTSTHTLYRSLRSGKDRSIHP
ncbi:hypothetical protein F66182_8913 [Fusarium sp. NRRL 66182]|nr:hypothetical protein F66182_8913 [Fusarium sp. NRRL 66182]